MSQPSVPSSYFQPGMPSHRRADKSPTSDKWSHNSSAPMPDPGRNQTEYQTAEQRAVDLSTPSGPSYRSRAEELANLPQPSHNSSAPMPNPGRNQTEYQTIEQRAVDLSTPSGPSYRSLAEKSANLPQPGVPISTTSGYVAYDPQSGVPISTASGYVAYDPQSGVPISTASGYVAYDPQSSHTNNSLVNLPSKSLLRHQSTEAQVAETGTHALLASRAESSESNEPNTDSDYPSASNGEDHGILNKFYNSLFSFNPKKARDGAPSKIVANTRLTPSSDALSHRDAAESVIQQPDEVQYLRIDQLKQSDILIAMMGPTGAGKSSFISQALGKDMGIGHDLQSYTSEVRALRVPIPGENADVVLVDTPGFDDTHKTDYQILQLISNWLKETGMKNIRLDGVLYLHRISDNRMAGTPLRNLDLFEKICGPKWFGRVVLVTTMWDEVDEVTGVDREKQLKAEFWEGMLRRGVPISTASGYVAYDPQSSHTNNSLVNLPSKSLLRHQSTEAQVAETGTHALLASRAESSESNEPNTDSDYPSASNGEDHGILNKFYNSLFSFNPKKARDGAPSKIVANTRLTPSSDALSHRDAAESVIQQPDEVQYLRIDQLKQSDILIAMMGPTGAGKSSFISQALGKDMGIGHDLQSYTSEVRALRVPIPGENADVVLVDTPGFDDTHKTDYQILQLISNWLKETGMKNIRLDGVLYLHRISDNRMAGTPLRNLDLFEKICGPKWFGRVLQQLVFIQSKKGSFTSSEEQLKAEFWAGMLRRGSRTERYKSTYDSAWEILKSTLVVARKRQSEPKAPELKVKPKLQKETADKGKALPKTEAGYELYSQINEMQQKRTQLIHTLDKQIDRSDSEDMRQLLQDQPWEILNSTLVVARKRQSEPKAPELKVKPKLQKETADKGKALPKTEAGYELYSQINEMQQKRTQLIHTLDKQIDRSDSEDMKQLLQDQRNQLQQESEAAIRDIGSLKLAPPQRFLKSFKRFF
ncbi:hypothetical protein AN958_12158 [Leucoagaricus sp. SymC.cos]|nr:hypothetical protein AN958_12158 [Leucoagaricus sp. SymC.cos]